MKNSPGAAVPDVRRPVVTVLHAEHRPPGMEVVESAAEVRYATAKNLRDQLPGADVLFVWDFFSGAVEPAFPAADRLRWLHVASAGVDAVLFPAMRESDVVLTNSRGVFEGAIAEWVLGVILAFAKDFRTTVDAQREAHWFHRETERIAARRALVIGTGPIGRTTARMLRAIDMDVAGLGRTRRDDDPDFGVVHGFDELTAELGRADYVIALAPLTALTEGMFRAETFAAMRPTARLVNAGRGALVVTADLVDALRAGTIAGAALDVFDTEPLPADSPLWSMPNVFVSPHMSGDFVGWLPALADVFVANFRRWQAGEALRNVVDKTLGYVPTGVPVR